MELPVTRLPQPSDAETIWTPQYKKLQVAPVTSPDLIQLSDTDGLSTSPQQDNISDGESTSAYPSKCDSPDSEPTHVGSPSISSTASDSPTPTNSMAQEKNWESDRWNRLIAEEHRQLLGTEEESSDRHSSDEDDDVWIISQEQREYYTNQFRSLQSDLMGKISGATAKNFFEKSRLPVHELRKIWQLADVTKDGALSLHEFFTAMHLVVLRRNDVELPDILPSSLVPPFIRPPCGEIVPHVEPPDQQPPPCPITDDCASPPTLTSQVIKPVSPPQNKEWTKFADSPTSTVSSPGPKPVNFDFQKSALEQDPKIFHPVAVRLTPESHGLQNTEDEVMKLVRKVSDPLTSYDQLPGSSVTDHLSSPKKSQIPSHGSMESDIRPIQRPQAKKPAAPGPGAIPPPPPPVMCSGGIEDVSGPTSLPPMPLSTGVPKKGDPPPPPPPRPYRTHARSSSLDLNQIGRITNLLGAPPAVPPRISPNATSPKKLVVQRSEGDTVDMPPSFADFRSFGKDRGGSDFVTRKHGAFEIYRKPVCVSELPHTKDVPDSQSHDESLVGEGEDETSAILSGRRTLLDSIRRLKKQNRALGELSEELMTELASVREERIGLEHQVQRLQPFSE